MHGKARGMAYIAAAFNPLLCAAIARAQEAQANPTAKISPRSRQRHAHRLQCTPVPAQPALTDHLVREVVGFSRGMAVRSSASERWGASLMLRETRRRPVLTTWMDGPLPIWCGMPAACAHRWAMAVGAWQGRTCMHAWAWTTHSQPLLPQAGRQASE